MRNITVDILARTPVPQHLVEIVERKGIGHPDTICDSIMERVSVELSRWYRDRFGRILHHNIDKAFLVAGQADVRLGGGRVTEPMRLIFGDRATTRFNGVDIPIEDIAIQTARTWIAQSLRFVDPVEHVKYDVQIKPGSTELQTSVQGERPTANDTSAAVGYAPLSPTEQVVLDAERLLNGPDLKCEFPEVGEDIKVMGYRRDSELHLTVAAALVDRFIDSEATYFRRKAALHEALMAGIGTTRPFSRIHLYINTLDRPGRGLEGMYLSVTGTSAESGDSGQVGRGNKVNGVIALNRPMGTEAAAGKNPVSHVGKIYSILTHQVAERAYTELRDAIDEIYVWMLSQIGTAIDQPKIAAAQVVLKKHARRRVVERRVREILDASLADIDTFVQRLADGQFAVA
jgi:S-adenosylmethionine synthetase